MCIISRTYLKIIRNILKDGAVTDINVSDWNDFFLFCNMQSIVGMVYKAIQQWPVENAPSKDILYEFILTNEQIHAQNLAVNKRCLELISDLKEKGYRSCVLKGQGNAIMYATPWSRMPGDIDLWVDLRDKEVIELVVEKNSNPHYQYHHVDYPVFKDVMVELHYRPSFFNNFIFNRRFQKYVEKARERQFTNFVEFPEGGVICRPTFDFNCIFQMSHLMRHYFEGGIGLRQFIDYFYLLRTREKIDRDLWHTQFKYFGMLKFARGVMWIEKEILGLDERYLLIETDETIGKNILFQVMEGGSWGQYQRNYKQRKGKWNRFISLMKHNLFLIKDFPMEVISQPLFLLWHQWWKLKMKIRLM